MDYFPGPAAGRLTGDQAGLIRGDDELDAVAGAELGQGLAQVASMAVRALRASAGWVPMTRRPPTPA
jgi:hypothetical protein